MRTVRFRAPAILITSVAFLELLDFLFGPFGMAKEKTVPDFLFLVLILLHGLWVYRLLAGGRRAVMASLFRTPEVLFVLTLVLFLLSFIFASNANMDYVQRFAATKGNIRLAPDSAIQRLNSAARYLPLFAVQIAAYLAFRLRAPRLAARLLRSTQFTATWGLALAMLSAFLFTLSFPSFLSLGGWGPVAFVALVPLFLAFSSSGYGRGVFYGVAFGVAETMLTNYWLGTFSLVSLQFVTVVMLIEYAIFMALMLIALKRLPRLGFLILPLAWVAFDWLKSVGFLGYPWDMIGVTQYRFTPFIQIASLTGVWGVSFLVLAANSVLAQTALGLLRRARERRRATEGTSRSGGSRALRGLLTPLAAYLALFLIVLVLGFRAVAVQHARTGGHTVRIALIQQDTDPRKNDYADTFAILKRLTNEALSSPVDLVVWSETAFVPNIRKWSTLSPTVYPFAKLVDEFLAYQKSTGHWLLTGNDDYFESINAEGKTVRKDYNAAVLFSPAGRRVQTYHKIHLVPFTEYFPYKKQLPFIYNMLTNFDVYLWEPGTKHVVFRTPKLAFSTPICFEDAFPNDVRQFVAAGAQAIVNISNDYWSQTPVEGQQHYMNSLFRAVENRRPLLRATASGLTAYVDTAGSLRASVPYYRQASLVVKVPIHPQRETLYTRLGDWFPKLSLAAFALIFLASLFAGMRYRRR